MKMLIAGAALAAAVGVTQFAEAGHHRSYRPCVPTYSSSGQSGWFNFRSANTRYYVPSSRPVMQGAAPAGPPIAAGQGQTIRRFSEEPGVEAAPQGIAPAPAVATPRAIPSAGSQRRYPYSGPPRNPVERRLRPGQGWQR